jgi:hypothetical protein
VSGDEQGHANEARRKWLRTSQETTWPIPDTEDDDRSLAWVLTYGTPTREELLRAASVVSAYGYMVSASTRENRDLVCREIRAHLRAEAQS